MRAINSVNEDVIRAFMIERVLPAIRANAASRCQQANIYAAGQCWLPSCS
jgi:hypothetical protein